MTTIIQFALLGLGVGTAYTLLAQGVILIYRGSNALNFAHGAVAMLAAYLYWQLREGWGLVNWLSMLITIGICGILGWVCYQLVMRPLSRSSQLGKAIATLGLFMLLQGLALLIWGAFPKTLSSDLPTKLLTVGGISVGLDKILLLVIAVVLTGILWLVSHHTPVGLAIRANAENARATATLGWSPDALGSLTWGLGWAVAAVAGILIAPLVGVSVDALPLLIIPVLAAALVGRMSSFWWTLVGSMGIGICQSLVGRYVDNVPGATQAVPFLVILLLLLVHGRGVPTRTTGRQSLPELGTGRIRWVWALLTAVLAVVLLLYVFPEQLSISLGVTASWAMILLSVVVILGYTGQLSLAQAALGGVAAIVAGRLVVDVGVPFWLAAVLGLVAAVVVGAFFALPALRARGSDLAIVTLGLGSCASALVFTNGDLTGGYDGTPVGPQSLFGLDLDTIMYPRRWVIFVVVLLALLSVLVANIRRGSTGRRMIAVRTNERAASALGINVVRVKLYAFCLAALVAGVGGITLAFRNPTIIYSEFDPIQSVMAVGYGFIGGVGFNAGAPMGATLADGGFGSWLINEIFPGASSSWLMTFAGLSVVVLAIVNPNGLVHSNMAHFRALVKRVRRGRAMQSTPQPIPVAAPHSVRPANLVVESIVVRFGGVTAVDGASLTVHPGEVVGLIGPNGAGKTTLIDTITGFVRPAEGTVSVDDCDVTRWPVYRRTRAGLSRSFQSLELFESSTVRENLGVASDPRSAISYLQDMVLPSPSPLSAAAIAAVRELDLADCLDLRVSDLSYGKRRLVAIARAIATEPSVLLLDEPAAGLSSDETMELARVIRRLAQQWGLGVLVVEHDMAFVMSLCDNIVVLNFGRQIASGTPDVVRSDPAVIEAYLGGQHSLTQDVPVGAALGSEM